MHVFDKWILGCINWHFILPVRISALIKPGHYNLTIWWKVAWSAATFPAKKYVKWSADLEIRVAEGIWKSHFSCEVLAVEGSLLANWCDGRPQWPEGSGPNLTFSGKTKIWIQLYHPVSLDLPVTLTAINHYLFIIIHSIRIARD